MQKLHDAEYRDVELTHILADNCAMQLMRRPKQFDVIVTDNLFGDVLSDEAAQATGSIGMLPSASLGKKNERTGSQPGLYEPVHGTAPDIAGQDLANPIACILSLAMCLRYSFGRVDDAKLIERAVETRAERRLAHRRHHAARHEAGRHARDGRCRDRGARTAEQIATGRRRAWSLRRR